MDTKILTLRLLLTLPTILLASMGLSQGQEGHGGDGIALSATGSVILLDEAECSEDFFPEDFEESWQSVLEALSALQNHQLHNAVTYLKSYLSNGRLTWCFVDLPLREVDDEGEISVNLEQYQEAFQNQAFIEDPFSYPNPFISDQLDTPIDLDAPLNEFAPPPFVLAFGKYQIAKTFPNGLVQIHRGLFQSLKPKSMAKLFLHEALWHAVGIQLVKTAEPIRRLTNLLLSPNLKRYRTDRLINTLNQFLGSIADKSPLMQRFMADWRQKRQPLHGYAVREHDTEFGLVRLVHLTEGKLSHITQLNPNYAAPQIYIDKYGLAAISSSQQENFQPIELNRIGKLCEGLPIASSDITYRLPTPLEILKLFNHIHIDRIEFATRRMVWFSASPENPGQRKIFTTLTSQIYPRNTAMPLVLLANNGQLIDVSNDFRNVSDRYPSPFPQRRPRQPALRDQMDITYPYYFCVADRKEDHHE